MPCQENLNDIRAETDVADRGKQQTILIRMNSLFCGNMGHLDRVGVLSYQVAASEKFASGIQIHSGNIKGLSQVRYYETIR